MSTTTNEPLTIREAAAEMKISEDTIRYYERIGLTPRVSRAASGHRRYDENDLGWLRFVTAMRAAGMSIEALTRYAALTRLGDQTLAERRAILIEHAGVLETRIEEMRTALAHVHHKIERLESGIAASS